MQRFNGELTRTDSLDVDVNYVVSGFANGVESVLPTRLIGSRPRERALVSLATNYSENFTIEQPPQFRREKFNQIFKFYFMSKSEVFK